jgi:hypothetical protein
MFTPKDAFLFKRMCIALNEAFQPTIAGLSVTPAPLQSMVRLLIC